MKEIGSLQEDTQLCECFFFLALFFLAVVGRHLKVKSGLHERIHSTSFFFLEAKRKKKEKILSLVLLRISLHLYL